MKPDSQSQEAPAPQLPNIPISIDDPFNPNLERREPVTPSPKPETEEKPAKRT